MKQLYKTALLASTCTITFYVHAGNNPKAPEGFKANTISGITFTENKGQVCDQHYKPRPDVLFSGTDGQMVFHLKNNGISYQLNRIDSWKKRESPYQVKGLQKKGDSSLIPDQSTIYRLDINWLNANQISQITKGKTLEGYNNYYLEHCPGGALNVKSYTDVTYQNIYEGIDLKWYQKDGHLKYDYLAAAGADHKQIKLQINGTEKISINSKGQLILKTPLGEIIEHAPLVKQAGRTLKSKWLIENNVISFDIENLNHQQDFVIDPVVRVWGTYYGGSGSEFGNSCYSDAIGNVYLAGAVTANAGTIIATSGAHQTVYGASFDAFLVKFNAIGVRQWGTYYGGSGDDYFNSCAIDAAGNVYLAGASTSSAGTVIATAGAHQSVHGGGGGYDAILVKFNTSGVRQWGTYYGGTLGESGNSCATDALGNVYLAGTANSNSGTVIATSGSHQSAIAGGADAFLVKFSPLGVRQWGTYYGDTGTDQGYSCATDATGNVYLAGLTVSSTGTSIATAGAHQSVYGGGAYDAFLVKFDGAGVRQWGTCYGGVGMDIGYSCTTDATGNVYLGGQTNLSTGTTIATPGAHQLVNGGSNDAFLVKFNSLGIRQWGTYYGGTGADIARSCGIDATGYVYLLGNTTSSTGTTIATAGAYQAVYGGGGLDAYLVKFNLSGVRQWGTYYGGTQEEDFYSCSVDGSGNVYLSGHTNATVGPVIASAGAHQTANGGGTYDAFLVKMLECIEPSNPTGSNVIVCANNTATLTATSGTAAINWYATPTSTTVLSTGTAYITPTLSAGTFTYYAEAFACGASLMRTPVTVTVNPIPTISIGGNTLICSGNSTTLSANYIGPVSSLSTPASSGYADVGYYFTINANSSITINSLVSYIAGNSGTVNLEVYYKYGGYLGFETSPGSWTLVGSGIVNTGVANFVYPGLTNFTIGTGQQVSFLLSTGSSNKIPNFNFASSIAASNSDLSITNGAAIVNTVAFGSGTVFPNKNSPFVLNYTKAGILWSNLSTNANIVVNPIITTNYNATVSLNNCSNTAAATVSVRATPTIAVNNGSICAGQSFTISPSGASTYSYSGGSNVVAPISNTNYAVTGTSSLGCISSNTAIANVTVAPLPTVSVNSGTICSGNVFVITPGGANTYTVQGGSTNVSPLSSVIYTVKGTALNGCVSANTATSNVTVFTTPTVNVNSGTICVGQAFTISPTGANTYTVQGGSNTVTPLANSSYTVAGTSTAGCLSQNVATSNVSVAPLPTITAPSGSICAGQTYTIQPSGASTYTIQGGSNTVSPLSNTSYTLRGTSTAGCLSQNIANVSVIVYSNPTITANSGSICVGNNFTITPGGASTYTIQGGNAIVSPGSTTNYTVSGTSTAGCLAQNTATASVTVNANPTITVNSGSICSGSNFTMTPNGASTYTYSSGNGTVNPSTTTSYSITGTSTAGCLSSNTAVSTVSVSPSPTLGVNSGSVCSGSSFVIVPVGATSYTYSGGSATVNPNTTTSYSVTGTNSLGCISTNTAISNVTVHSLPNVTVSAPNATICTGESTTLTVGGASLYSWSMGATNSIIVVSPTTATQYSVTGTDANGCVKTTAYTLVVEPCTGITKTEGQTQSILIYPNPNNGYLTINSPTKTEITIVNALGQQILKQTIQIGENKVDLFEQAKGVYFIILTADSEKHPIKVVKY